MSRTEALAAWERLPIPDTTEEHWRFTNLRDFDPASFAGAATAEIETMLDLDVAGYATVTADGNENEQAATKDAFDVLHYIAAKRLAAGKLTVVDATNVQREARRPLIELARALGRLPAELVIVGVEAEHFRLGEPLSPPVAAAVETAARTVAGVLRCA